MMRDKSELRDGQQQIITDLYQHDEMICVLRPGGGKTVSALTAIHELLRDGAIRHALVTAPKRVARVVWPDELASWNHVRQLRHAVLTEGPAERGARLASAPGRDLTIFGHDILDWMLGQIESLPDHHPIFDLLVIDEISRFRNPTGERYKLLIKHINRWKMVWGLSGTLRPSSSLDLFGPARLVTRGKLWGRSFYQWQRANFFPTDYNQYNWEAKPGAEDQINAEIAPYITTCEVPHQDAPTVILDRVELPVAARDEYKKMERKLFATLGEIELDDGAFEEDRVVADSRAISVGKLAQMANGFVYRDDEVHRLHDVKRDWLKDLIENSTAPLMVIFQYQEDFRMLCDVLGRTPPYLGAGISDRQAQAWINDWNAGKLAVFGIQMQSASHGLNLQFGGSDMAWISPTWDSEAWEQTIARLNRSGQTKQVIVRVCVADGTVDELKLDRVHGKMSAQAAFEKYLQQVRHAA